MYTIIEHIEYLLLSHDCVIIPGWGALVAQYNDSAYLPDSGVLSCPERRLGFNASVNHNDGLLAHSIVRREGVGYDEAVRVIGRSVSAFRAQLSSGQDVSLGRLGYFRGNRDGAIEFVPFDQISMGHNYYGLRAVSVAELAGKATSAAGRRAFGVPLIPRRYRQAAASILVLLCLTALLTTPIVVNRDRQDYAALALPGVTGPQAQDIGRMQRERSATLVQAGHGDGASTSLMLDEGGECYLVVASLTSPKQAQAFMDAHPDLSGKAQILKVSERLFYVYVARSDDRARLYALRGQLSRDYRDAWVKF